MLIKMVIQIAQG